MTYVTDKHYNCMVTTSSGDQVRIHANQIHNNGHDYFSGWHCHAGTDRIHIDEQGQVWSGTCRNDRLGDLSGWDLLDAPTICNQTRCNGCTDDLIVKKYQTISTSEP
jgi:hypothetical protein